VLKSTTELVLFNKNGSDDVRENTDEKSESDKCHHTSTESVFETNADIDLYDDGSSIDGTIIRRPKSGDKIQSPQYHL